MNRDNVPFTIILTLCLALAACAAPAQPTSVPENTPGEIIESPTALPVPTATGGSPESAETSQPPKDTAPLPGGAVTITALGDSLTQGDGDESGAGGYPARLAEKINALRPAAKMINLGRSGWTSADLINGVNGEAATLPQALQAKPDIALVWIGSNDLWYLYEYGPEPMTPETEQQDLDTYANNIDTILSQLTGGGAKVFVALLDDQSKRPVAANPPNPAEPAFSAITTADLALMSAHVGAMNEIIREKAEKYGAVTVDFYHTDLFTNPATLYSDGNHPNSAGYDIIAATWFAAMESSLR